MSRRLAGLTEADEDGDDDDESDDELVPIQEARKQGRRGAVDATGGGVGPHGGDPTEPAGDRTSWEDFKFMEDAAGSLLSGTGGGSKRGSKRDEALDASPVSSRSNSRGSLLGGSIPPLLSPVLRIAI